MLPLELRGQTVTRPAGIGVGFEEAQMAHRRLAQVVERAETVHRVDAPAGVRTVVALPVERGLPALSAHGRPPLGEPQFRTVVAVLVDEGEVLRAGDQTCSKPIGLEINRVARRLVVECEGVG